MHSFGAVFVEVHIDPDLGTIRVPRVVGAYGVGKLMNKKTGHSQRMGGIVWGLGMGLMEKTEIDCRTGRPLNANLADYGVAAALANAVYHATGKRIRDLPITLDKLV
jgi:xanthine dehydrogenase YagR molybdenum-binding subunit